jgi:spiro-SPASM protein
MENTVLLCHLNTQVINLWTNSLKKQHKIEELNDTENLITTFADSLSQLEIPVFFSFESETEFTEKLSSLIKTTITKLPYSHELLLFKNIFKSDSFQSVYYIDSIYPLLDTGLSDKLFQIHNEYLADYSFIENAPAGISGVFFSRNLFDSIEIEKNENTEKLEIDTSIPDSMDIPLKDYIEKNINQFHVEIHFEHPDLRLLRLDFSGKNPRSIFLTRAFLRQIPEASSSYKYLEEIVNKSPEILHNFPSYLEVEINGSCEYNCTFCPRTVGEKQDDQRLSLDDIALLIEYCSSCLEDTSITLGGPGEPLEHPEITPMLNLLLDSEHTPVVILETNGKHLDKILSVFNHKKADKLKIVVNINSLKSYDILHGTAISNKEKVLQNLDSIKSILDEKNPALKKNIFIQTLKIVDNETELDEIYNLAENLGYTFLLQKYNSYAHLMPEKRVSDMTPLERSFCWHLRRDLFIRANGNVTFCKQDISNSSVRGNIRNMSLKNIWASMKQDWENNYVSKFPKKPDCSTCDEYYTFNM